MQQNFLQLNCEKPEVTLLGSPHQLRKLNSFNMVIDGIVIRSSSEIRNRGVIFDPSLTFESHMQNVIFNFFTTVTLLDYHLFSLYLLRRS
ncbi:UNVERIFIED_CONTAM: hypothetical protein FKN15_068484 [Acipenser sinensis]